MSTRVETFVKQWVPILAVVGTFLLWLNNTWQLEVMRETLRQNKAEQELDQRPWVGLREIRDVTIAPNQPIRTTLTFSNSGKTTALKVDSKVVAIHDPSRRPIDAVKLAADAQQADISSTEGTLFPGVLAHTVVTSRFILTEQDYQNLQQGKGIIYLIGTMTYWDQFNHSHTTLTCIFYDPATKGFPFSQCSKYNSAD